MYKKIHTAMKMVSRHGKTSIPYLPFVFEKESWHVSRLMITEIYGGWLGDDETRMDSSPLFPTLL